MKRFRSLNSIAGFVLKRLQAEHPWQPHLQAKLTDEYHFVVLGFTAEVPSTMTGRTVRAYDITTDAFREIPERVPSPIPEADLEPFIHACLTQLAEQPILMFQRLPIPRGIDTGICTSAQDGLSVRVVRECFDPDGVLLRVDVGAIVPKATERAA